MNNPNMDCGIWHCEVGAWNIVFADNKQEFFNVIEGLVRLHDKNSDTIIEVGAGEAGIIPLNAVTPVLGAPVIIYVIVNQRKIQYFN